MYDILDTLGRALIKLKGFKTDEKFYLKNLFEENEWNKIPEEKRAFLGKLFWHVICESNAGTVEKLAEKNPQRYIKK